MRSFDSIECRKKKRTNHSGQSQQTHYYIQSYEPIGTRPKLIHVTDVKRGKTPASKSRLVLVLRLIG